MNTKWNYSLIWSVLIAAVMFLLIMTGFGPLYLDAFHFTGWVLISHISAGLFFCIMFCIGCFFWIKTSSKLINIVLIWCSIAFCIPVILSIAVMTFPVLDTSQMIIAAWVHHLSSFLFCILFLPVLITQLRG